MVRRRLLLRTGDRRLRLALLAYLAITVHPVLLVPRHLWDRTHLLRIMGPTVPRHPTLHNPTNHQGTMGTPIVRHRIHTTALLMATTALLTAMTGPPQGSPYARPVSAFREHGVENERDWDQNHAAGFREPPEPRVSDDLRRPLPRPAEFDQLAKPSQAQGAMPVREIPQFDSMRDDPDFRSKGQPSKPQREARLSPKQPGVLAKAASPPPPATPLRKWKTPAEILAGPSPAILKAAEERNSNRKRPHDDTRRQDEGGRRQDKETLRRESHQKRPRWERPFEQSPRGRDRRERSFRDDSAGDIEGRRSRSRDSYHRDSGRPFSPLPADAGTPPPQSRTSSRRSSFASQVGEARQRRSMSRASFVSSGTHESDLSSVGAELLGLPSKAKEEKERDDIRKRNMNRIKKRTVPKVDNVYSRRW
ncbi:uncharacterized protein VDAG_07905 [Verticillium dahliae VdLs.17]|uniref:Uncharacterized protein n=1 Tax=Verticillium dahliae (strain VdLs.17 / ATCC MYA-4575 / FGSC 10137) TaxID=498257 RepID=G2XCM3_VERDV|nr:uncharacterized protein VDAG_07905 [Verticillium dahliae VdLs.17]EGY16741.1 hypothetical protein VDAG_07905 [Verticillium dahliae VdLs.17]